MKTLASPRSSFYFFFNLIVLALVIGGFGLNAIVHTEKLPPVSVTVYLHGMVMLVWYILILYQSGLVRSGNIPLHQKLGKASILLALGIVISGIWMSVVHYSRPDGFVFTTINTFILINFTILYFLAWKNRFRSEYHKRYMILVSLSAVFPALGRVILGLNLNQYLSVPLWIVLVLVVGFYDFKSEKKIHPATKIGTGMILVGIALTLILMENSVWKEFLDGIMQ